MAPGGKSGKCSRILSKTVPRQSSFIPDKKSKTPSYERILSFKTSTPPRPSFDSFTTSKMDHSFLPTSSSSSDASSQAQQNPSQPEFIPYGVPQYITVGADMYADDGLYTYSWHPNTNSRLQDPALPFQANQELGLDVEATQGFKARGDLGDGATMVPPMFGQVYTLTPAQSPLLARRPQSSVAHDGLQPATSRPLKRFHSESQSDCNVVESVEHRKKSNIRVDLPEHITLGNVDEMIAEATAAGNDKARRELKLVKRLRRNREAAFTSRQRKKAYTEQLEGEKSELKGNITQLESQLTLLKSQLRDSERERERLTGENADIEATTRSREAELTQLQNDRAALQDVCHRQSMFLKHALPAGVVSETRDVGSSVVPFMPLASSPHSQQALFDAVFNGMTPAAAEPYQAASDLLLWLMLLGALVASQSLRTKSPALVPEMPQRVQAAGKIVMDASIIAGGVGPSSSAPGYTSAHDVGRAPVRPSRPLTVPPTVPAWLTEQLSELQRQPESRLTERKRRRVTAPGPLASPARFPEPRIPDLPPEVVSCLKHLITVFFQENIVMEFRGLVGGGSRL